MPEEVNFAGRLREIRVKAGLSQGQLGEATGLSQGMISSLEAGRNSPVWETVVKLSKALGCSCQDFLAEPAGDVEAPKRGRPAKAEADVPLAKKGKGKAK